MPEINRKIGAGNYSISVSNRSSSGPTLVMAVLLDLPTENAPSPAKTATVAATPISAPTTLGLEQDSPFAGDWTGGWTNEDHAREGSFKLRVKPDGSLSGRLAFPNLKVAAKFDGRVEPNGTFRLSYTQLQKDAAVEGVLKFLSDARQEIGGRASFSTDGTVFGKGDFVLEKAR